MCLTTHSSTNLNKEIQILSKYLHLKTKEITPQLNLFYISCVFLPPLQKKKRERERGGGGRIM